MNSFKKAVTLLALVAPAAMAMNKPKQGVFLQSNQPNNEIGVYESLDNGALSWVGAFETGGIGYPEAEGSDQFNALGSSNALTYHVYNNKQWVLAANAGGPTGDASISLLEINQRSLQLTLTSQVELDGIFACSVAAFDDRVCAVTCAGAVTMECFRINPENAYELEKEFKHDFGGNIPPVENRPNATSAAYGPGNILFSGDGLQVGIILKGNARLSTEEIALRYSVPLAGFHSFPVLASGGYGAPSFLSLPDESLPFAFAWRSGELGTNKQIVLVANIAGDSRDYPACGAEERCQSSVTSLLADINGNDLSVELSLIEEVNTDQVDACWIDYRFGHFYTGNFISDSITIGTVARNGTMTIERNTPTGRGTVPNDVVHMGRKIDGQFFLYTENQGTAEVGVHRVIEDETFSSQLQIMAGAPYPAGTTGRDWIGSNGMAATTLSEEELFVMYDYQGAASNNGNGSDNANDNSNTVSSPRDSRGNARRLRGSN